MNIAIIMSGTYVQADLLTEFGAIPPSFLPLGNRRLYRHQVSMLLDHCDHVYIVLPSSYDQPHSDIEALKQLKVKTIFCDPTISISQAKLHVLEAIPEQADQLIFLYGDTLISNLAKIPLDCYSAHTAVDEYKWASAPLNSRHADNSKSNLVVSGLFSFSDLPALKDALVNEANDIIQALVRYDQSAPLTMLVTGDWHDFGHTQTYYRSCGLITTQRYFNTLNISRHRVKKNSTDTLKIRAEASWFENLPPAMRIYTPTYLGRVLQDGRTVGYSTENTYLSTLASLASFGNLHQDTWISIFRACDEFLKEAQSHIAPVQDSFSTFDYYLPKTAERLNQFSLASGFDCDSELTLNDCGVPSLNRMAEITADILKTEKEPQMNLIHGDFCFSNIFYDLRSRLVKVIDPRGISPKRQPSIYGDPRYDVAKLSHSVIGRYDEIISGNIKASNDGLNFSLDMSLFETPMWSEITKAFDSIGFLQSPDEKRTNGAIMVHLFLSMLPLHADRPSHQTTFIANSARLFLELEK
jgi:hypothetical protein